MKALKAAGCDEIVTEAYTGTKMDRPKLDKLLAKLQPGDEFVVCKLDRFARTAAEGSIIVRELVDRGVAVNILNMGKADNTPVGKLTVTIMLAFAEYERDMIVERTQAGKEIARERDDYREGRPRIEVDTELLEGESIAAACRRLGVSRATYYRRMREVRA